MSDDQGTVEDLMSEFAEEGAALNRLLQPHARIGAPERYLDWDLETDWKVCLETCQRLNLAKKLSNEDFQTVLRCFLKQCSISRTNYIDLMKGWLGHLGDLDDWYHGEMLKLVGDFGGELWNLRMFRIGPESDHYGALHAKIREAKLSPSHLVQVYLDVNLTYAQFRYLVEYCDWWRANANEGRVTSLDEGQGWQNLYKAHEYLYNRRQLGKPMKHWTVLFEKWLEQKFTLA